MAGLLNYHSGLAGGPPGPVVGQFVPSACVEGTENLFKVLGPKAQGVRIQFLFVHIGLGPKPTRTGPGSPARGPEVQLSNLVYVLALPS